MQRICGCLLDWIFLCDLFISAQKAATYQESSQRCTLQFRGINVTCLATTRQNGNLSQAQCLGILWAPEKGAGIFPSKFHGGKKNSHHPQALETFNDSWVSCHAVMAHFGFKKNQGTACTLDRPWHLDICQLGIVYMTVGPTWDQGVRVIINDSRLGDGKACIYSPIATGPESIRKCAYVVIYVRM